MTLHKFGVPDKSLIVLIHPSVVYWDYFEYVIPLLEKDFQVIVPALPGYDTERSELDFSSIEAIASELADQLKSEGHSKIHCLFGCCMGGSIVMRMLADQKIDIEHAIIDAGITPYPYPWLLTRLIAVKDYLLISFGKYAGFRLLEKAFSTDNYSDEDLRYIADVLKFMSRKTIWRTFESCNNYSMPKESLHPSTDIHYWYTKAEAKA
ncbi:MAG: alpha/beta hydrolase, partial [Eubacteriales bacterium]|nr:alpha/beta hydrolase [Eubacteriales bacterium]